MDWIYKHFHLETVFPAARNAVLRALRAFFADTLPDWTVEETPQGFAARGRSGLHAAVAEFRIESTAAGTQVAVALRVRRYSIWGYTLWDIGGYYDAQIRKWLRGIQWCLYQQLIAGAQRRDTTLDEWQSDWRLKNSSRSEKAVKIVMIWWLLGLLLQFAVMPAIGIVTGFLIVPGPATLYGTSARTASAALLLVAGHAAWSSTRGRA